MVRHVHVNITDITPTGQQVSGDQYELTFEATWLDNDGQPQSRTEVEKFPNLIGWLINNHPQAAKRYLTEVCWKIARVKYGLDEASDL